MSVGAYSYKKKSDVNERLNLWLQEVLMSIR